MTNIKTLLNKYEAPYVPGEKRTSEYDKVMQREHNLRRRKQLAKLLKYEASHLHITESEMQTIDYFIELFNNDFKYLHGRASDETIILAFMYYTVRLRDSSIKLDNRITSKYGLTNQVFSLIICRMLDIILKKQPIPIISTKEYNHEILYETHGQTEKYL